MIVPVPAPPYIPQQLRDISRYGDGVDFGPPAGSNPDMMIMAILQFLSRREESEKERQLEEHRIRIEESAQKTQDMIAKSQIAAGERAMLRDEEAAYNVQVGGAQEAKATQFRQDMDKRLPDYVSAVAGRVRRGHELVDARFPEIKRMIRSVERGYSPSSDKERFKEELRSVTERFGEELDSLPSQSEKIGFASQFVKYMERLSTNPEIAADSDMLNYIQGTANALSPSLSNYALTPEGAQAYVQKQAAEWVSEGQRSLNDVLMGISQRRAERTVRTGGRNQVWARESMKDLDESMLGISTPGYDWERTIPLVVPTQPETYQEPIIRSAPERLYESATGGAESVSKFLFGKKPGKGQVTPLDVMLGIFPEVNDRSSLDLTVLPSRSNAASQVTAPSENYSFFPPDTTGNPWIREMMMRMERREPEERE